MLRAIVDATHRPEAMIRALHHSELAKQRRSSVVTHTLFAQLRPVRASERIFDVALNLIVTPFLYTRVMIQSLSWMDVATY